MLAKTLFPYILGIFMSHFLLPIIGTSYTELVQWQLLLLALLFLTALNSVQSLLFGVFIQVFFFAFGVLRIASLDPDNQVNYFSQHSSDYLIAAVRAEPVQKPKYIVYELGIQATLIQGKLTPRQGRMLLYIYLDSSRSGNIQYGDQLLFKSNYSRILGPKNPGEFNYARYLSTKGIYYQQFIKPTDYRIIGHNQGFSFYKTSLAIRNYIVDKFRYYLTDYAHFQVLSALIIGHKTELEPSNYRLFAQTGTIHLLAISGMHVGIIFQFVQVLMQYLPGLNKVRQLHPWLISSIIWIYVYCTGLSPSAIRAGIMLTYFLFSRRLLIFTGGAQALAAAALINLLLFPLDIYSLGFQFSYCAVIGITVFQRMVPLSKYIQNRVLQYLILCVGMSMGAQLLCAPLLIYNFGSFPSYFLLANIWTLIPIHVLMLCGIILACSFGEWFAVAISHLIRICLDIMLKGLEQLVDLPYAMVEFQRIDLLTLLGSYLFIGMFIYTFYTTLPPARIPMLFLLLLFLSYQSFRLRERVNNSFLSLYQVNRELVFSIYSGGKVTVFSTLASLQHPWHTYYIFPHLNRYATTAQLGFQPLQKKRNYTLTKENVRLIILQEELTSLQAEPWDLVLIHGMSMAEIMRSLPFLHCRQIGFYQAISREEQALIREALKDTSTQIIFTQGERAHTFSMHL